MDFENLILTGARAGIKPSEFWEMTYAEFSIVVEAYNERLKYEAEQMITQSYLTAALYRTKKMPKLEDLLEGIGKEEENKEMSDEAMLEKVKMLNKLFGGKEVVKCQQEQ